MGRVGRKAPSSPLGGSLSHKATPAQSAVNTRGSSQSGEAELHEVEVCRCPVHVAPKCHAESSKEGRKKKTNQPSTYDGSVIYMEVLVA